LKSIFVYTVSSAQHAVRFQPIKLMHSIIRQKITKTTDYEYTNYYMQPMTVRPLKTSAANI